MDGDERVIQDGYSVGDDGIPPALLFGGACDPVRDSPDAEDDSQEGVVAVWHVGQSQQEDEAARDAEAVASVHGFAFPDATTLLMGYTKKCKKMKKK